MINKDQAIIAAQSKVAHLDYIDPNDILRVTLSTREAALAAGVKDDPLVRSKWVVNFRRIATGHRLDGLFIWLSVWVDAETGEATIIESL